MPTRVAVANPADVAATTSPSWQYVRIEWRGLCVRSARAVERQS